MKERSKRWTFDSGGRPKDLVHDGRIVLSNGRPVKASDVAFTERGQFAHLESGDGSVRCGYTLLQEKGRVRLAIESVGKKVDDLLLGWTDEVFGGNARRDED